MPLPLSVALREAMYASSTDEGLLVLLTLDHPDLAQPIRVVKNTKSITSRGQIYSAAPFLIYLPESQEDSIPPARLRIDVIDRTITAALRSASLTPPTVTVELVPIKDLDVVEAIYEDLELRSADYNDFTIEAELGADPFLEEPFPGHNMDPTVAPGLHR